MLFFIAFMTTGDGCLENTPDTAQFSKEYQLHQNLYDPEHNYPGVNKWVSVTSYNPIYYT